MSDSVDVDIESYVLYKPPSGEKLHRRPSCATSKGLPTPIDAGASKLEHLEMYRVEELDITPDDVCGSCADRVQDYIDDG